MPYGPLFDRFEARNTSSKNLLTGTRTYVRYPVSVDKVENVTIISMKSVLCLLYVSYVRLYTRARISLERQLKPRAFDVSPTLLQSGRLARSGSSSHPLARLASA